MVGDTEVIQAEVLGCSDDFFERRAAVRFGGVAVKCASKVVLFDKPGKVSISCSLQFAAVFPQFWFNVNESEFAINARLIDDISGRVIPFVALHRSEVVFVEGQSLGQGQLSQGNVVFLAASEIHEGERELRIGDRAEVALHSVAQADGGFRIAVCDHFLQAFPSRKPSSHSSGV